MKRLTKGYLGVKAALFPDMLNVLTISPSRITSSPSQSSEPSPEHTTTAAPSTSEPQHSESSPDVEEHVPTPHDSPLYHVHSHKSDEGRMQPNELTNLVTKLSDRISVLENDLQKTKKTYSSTFTKISVLENDLQKTKKTYSFVTFTKLILRVKKLKNNQDNERQEKEPKIILLDDEAIADDSSK
ncbi:hypothetical protein Tco_1458467 [Tanacetum coccineum]